MSDVSAPKDMSERSQPRSSAPSIAVIGLAGSFPQAPRVDQLWRNILNERDAFTEVPHHRWPARYFDPHSSDPARFYARRGGFIDESARFEALRFGVMPRAVEGAEPDQLMTLQICAEALEDAGYAARASEESVSRRGFDRMRAQVIIGRGGYIGSAMNSLNARVRTLEQLDVLLEARGWGTPNERVALRDELLGQLRPFGPDTAIGLVPNLCASRVADRLGLGGAAYTIDAACASSLIAVERACEPLMSGAASLVIAGGVHLIHDLTFWSVFSQLGALSRRQQIRPFDADADGLLIGEGVGAVILKRLDEALRDGDRVYAVIRGVGTSSDAGRASLLSPDSEGQARAIRTAWSHLDPRRVGLIEAHGTGTPAGDLAELSSTALALHLEESGEPVGIGSIKSNIGHAMPAAGIAGLIKASLAIFHGVKPPTLHIESPHPLFGESRLTPQRTAEAWESSERWAGVSAFGFGGINAHLALGQAPRYAPLPPRIARLAEPAAVLGVAGESAAELAARLDALASADQGALSASRQIGSGRYRAAMIDPTPEGLKQAAELARSGSARRGRRGLWLSGGEVAERSPKSLALMFPGIEASFAPRIDDICARHGILSPELFPPDDLGARGVSVVRLGISLYQCFERLGLQAGHLLGHSIGEWTASICAGYLARGEIEPFIASLDPEALEVPEVVFLAVGSSAERARATLIAHLAEADPLHAINLDHHVDPLAQLGVYCSHDNCPHQSIFCAPPERSAWVIKTLMASQIIAQELPFRSGFHAPHFAPFATAFTQKLRDLSLKSPHTTLWSATTTQPYPQDPEEFYALSERHLVEAVRFRELTERLYSEGARVFVQLGVGSLSSFVGDTLRGRPHRVIDAHSERRSGWSQWLHLAATLFAEGYDVALEHLTLPGVRGPRAITLNLGSSLLQVNTTSSDDLTLSSESPLRRSPKDPPPQASPPSKAQPGRPHDVGAHRGLATYPSPLTLNPLAQESSDAWSARWSVTIDAFPYLRDHCFFRQPAHWPELSDLFPVVPMTLSVQWVMEVAQQLSDARARANGEAPRSRVVEVSDVRASKWIEVEPPCTLEVDAYWADEDEVKVSIRGHLTARARVAQTPPKRPERAWTSLEGELPPPLSASDIYRDRWMFHGSAYQGIDELTGIAPGGIRGVIRHDDTPGALLDNVGQLFGLWVMLTQEVDRVVMPVRLERVAFYGPPPPRGARLPCLVELAEVGRREVKAHMTLWYEGRVWASFVGWRDWRFETSGSLWGLMRYPEHNLYCEPLINTPQLTLTLAEGIASAASSREFLVGRCLNHVERAEYRALSSPRQRGWLAGRIAAKDAARAALWRSGAGPLYPIEFALAPSSSGGPPCFALESSQPLRGRAPYLSISHSAGLALAALSPPQASLRALGVDLERIIDRGEAEESWRQASFTHTERKRVERLPQERRLDAYMTLWVSKEAAAKAACALGVVEGLGSPKRWSAMWEPDDGASTLGPLEHLSAPILASGVCVVSLPDVSLLEMTHSLEPIRVRWWIIERRQQRWAIALAGIR